MTAFRDSLLLSTPGASTIRKIGCQSAPILRLSQPKLDLIPYAGQLGDMTLPPLPKVNLDVKMDLTEPTRAIVAKSLEKTDTALRPLENVWDCVTALAGMALDTLQELRQRNAQRVHARSQEILAERGISKLRPLPPKQAMKAMAAASLEHDSNLQEMWAQLLASAMDPEEDELPSSLIDILAEMDPGDAVALKHLSELEEERRIARDENLDAKLAQQLQERSHSTESEEALREDVRQVRKEAVDVPLAVWATTLGSSEQACLVRAAALSRLGCVAVGSQLVGTTWGSIRIPSSTEADSWTVAPLGRELLRWCLPTS